MLPRRRQGEGTEDAEMNLYQSNPRHISPYRLMLDGVSQQLTRSDCNRIGLIIGLKPAELDKIQDSVDLLLMMEERIQISERNVSYLREILKQIKKEAAVDCISQYEETLFGEDLDHSPETDSEVVTREQHTQVTSTREHSVQLLSVRYDRNQSQDQLAAESLSFFIEASLKECVRNKIVSFLFERVSRDDIFWTRRRFLKVVLKSLCLKKNFLDYMSFISDHNSFITQWILNYIASQCSEKKIDIEQIAHSEIDGLLSLTEHSLEEAIPVDGRRDYAFHQWLKAFSERFMTNVNFMLSEEAIAYLEEHIHVSNYDLFTTECRNIIRESTKTSLLESIDLPDPSDVLKVKWWLHSLPKKIHEVVAKDVQGCGTRCPFCKTFCEDTIKEHRVHYATWHFPRGIAGVVSEKSRRLVTDVCSENVASDKPYCAICYGFDAKCEHSAMTLSKNYKIDFPHWEIQPFISGFDEALYWKWVLITFNKDFAEYYGCKPALIPHTWGVITKEEALKSIQ